MSAVKFVSAISWAVPVEGSYALFNWLSTPNSCSCGYFVVSQRIVALRSFLYAVAGAVFIVGAIMSSSALVVNVPSTLSTGPFPTASVEATLKRYDVPDDRLLKTSLCWAAFSPDRTISSVAEVPKLARLLDGSSVVHSTTAELWVREVMVGPVGITGSWVSRLESLINEPAPPGGCIVLASFPDPELDEKTTFLPVIEALNSKLIIGSGV